MHQQSAREDHQDLFDQTEKRPGVLDATFSTHQTGSWEFKTSHSSGEPGLERGQRAEHRPEASFPVHQEYTYVFSHAQDAISTETEDRDEEKVCKSTRQPSIRLFGVRRDCDELVSISPCPAATLIPNLWDWGS